jgi:hypothetical protein
MLSGKGQTTIEMIVVVGFILILFTLILLVAHNKTLDSNDLKMRLDAKRVAGSLADNINTIAEQGHGYYRYFTLPQYLFGGTEYNISVYGSFVEVNWVSRHGEQGYIEQIVTANASKYCLDLNESKPNKVFNYYERVLLTCNRADFMLVDDSFGPETLSGSAGSDVNLSIEVFNYGVLDSGQFNVFFALINNTGDMKWNATYLLAGGVAADRKAKVDVTMTPQDAGVYTISVFADSDDEILESYELDNWYNKTFTLA